MLALYTHPALAQLPLPSPVAGNAPAAAAPPQTGLVDKLLDILSTKKVPASDLPLPPEPQVSGKPPAAKKSSGSITTIEISRNFVPIYSIDHDDEDDENPPVIPYFSTSPINQVHRRIVTLVIMVPDQTREAARAFAFARSAQEEASARHPEWNADASYLFSPQFLTPEDIAAHADNWADGGASLLRWPGSSWIIGGDSVPAPSKKDIWQGQQAGSSVMNSFTVMDYLILLMARQKLFPDLQKVVIAGTDGGADFVQRYAALGIAPAILAQQNIEVRFVPAGAHSFLYLDNHRLRRARTDPLSQRIEADAFAPAKTENCRLVNQYPYGLDNLPRYGRKNALNEVRVAYSGKRIIYLAGAGATLPLRETTPEACALAAQGNSVRDRSEVFFASLKRLYGDELDRMQRLYLVEGINEDGLSLWRSTCGGAALFGDGACSPNDTGKAMQIVH